MPMTAHRSAELRIAQATTKLVATHPFFASILFRLRRVTDPAAATMWTDGTHLGYNPAFVMEVGRDELAGVLAHEAMHVAGLHPWRQQGREHRAWNVACDQVVNAILAETGLLLPAGAVPGVAGKAPEELYVPPPPPREDAGAAPPAAGAAAAGNSGEAGSEPSAPGDGEGTAAETDPGGCGEVRAPTRPNGGALTEAERTRQMEEARIAVQQAMNAAKRAGSLPAGLERLVEEALEPRVPWREVLARFIDEQSRTDYSWTRPNRRYIAAGVVLPSLWAPGYGRIVMGCDTSGSVGADELREVCAEILGALTAYQERGQTPSLTVAWFDHAVYEQTVEEPEELRPRGGGGTSFRVVFEWLAVQEESPRAIVMVTDGYCSDYGAAPEIPVLWVLTRPNRGFRPPFGELISTQ